MQRPRDANGAQFLVRRFQQPLATHLHGRREREEKRQAHTYVRLVHFARELDRQLNDLR